MQAYGFAKGMAVQIAGAEPGGPVTQLDRPLDFLAITDHSEFLAIDFGCGALPDGTPFDPDSPFFNQPRCAAARSANHLDIAVTLSRQQALCGTTHPED